MPHLFRTRDGVERPPGKSLTMTLIDGTEVEALWTGSAQNEKLRWWLSKPGHELAQSDEVSAVAIRGEHTNKLRWGDTPTGAHLFFVLLPPQKSKSGHTYRLARMVTTACTPEQEKYFDDPRFALLGKFDSKGQVAKIAPLTPAEEPGD